MMVFHNVVDNYFELQVKATSNINKKLEVDSRMINCTIKYCLENEKRCLDFYTTLVILW